jgi:putative ABC transport system ATP-binding protein
VTEPLISIRDLRVARVSAQSRFELHVSALDIVPGQRLAVVGPSGCGKSTLLDVLALILLPARVGTFLFRPPGQPAIDLVPFFDRGDLDGLGRLRRRHEGYVLQTGGLLPFVSVRRNMEVPARLLFGSNAHHLERLAEMLGITDHLDKMPGELSAGERQRVAIARALIHRPVLVLADEPTAALDPARSDQVMGMFVATAASFETSVVIATHDLSRVERFSLQTLRHAFLPSSAPRTTASTFLM